MQEQLDGQLDSSPQSASAIRRPTTLDTEFHRGLGLYDSTMVVVGSMIGSGIFIVSADMARNIGSPGWLLVAWLLTGVLTVVGALSYGELAAMMPRAGGQYVYLREAFSPLWGFLYGWTLFLVIQTGTIAAVAVGFARYFGVLVPVDRRRPLSDRADPPLDRLRALAVDDAARRHRADRAADVDQHARPRIRPDHPERLHDGEDRRAARADSRRPAARLESRGRRRQLRRPVDARAASSTSCPGLTAVTAFGLFVAICVSQTGSLFSADAWNNITFTAGEVKDPRRNIPLSLALGTVHRHRPVPARERRVSRDAAVRRRSSTRRPTASPRRRSTRSFPGSARRSWRSAS